MTGPKASSRWWSSSCLPFFQAAITEAGPRSTGVAATVIATTAATRCAGRGATKRASPAPGADDSISNRAHQAEPTAHEDSHNQDEAGRLHQPGACHRLRPLGSVTRQSHADRQDDRKEYGAAQPKSSSRGSPNQQYRTRGHQEAVNFAASGHSKARNLPLHHIGMSNGLLSRG